MSKRYLFLLVVFALVVGTGSLAIQAQSELRFDGVEVHALIFRSTDTDYIISTLAPRLEQETGIKLIVDQTPYEDVRAKQLADRAGAHAYDILNSTTEWSYEYAEFASPLDEYLANPQYPAVEQDDMIPFVWSTFNPGENVKLIPYQPDTRLFFYRTDLFEAAGLTAPQTWDDVRAAAAALTKDTDGDGEVDQFGFLFPGQRGWNLMLAWVPFVYAAGGEIFSDGLPVIKSQAGLDALNFLIEMKQYAPADVTAFGEYEVNQTTTQGHAAMIVSASAITQELEAETSAVKGLIASSDFPLQSETTERKFSAALGGWAFGVTDYSEVKDAAAYAVMWLTSKDIVTEMEIHGRAHAARLSMAENAELLAVNPHVPTIVEVLSGAEIFYRGPQGASLGELLNVRIAQAVAGELTPEDALRIAQDELTAYIEANPA